ncbi:MAG TPA: class II aldolase/adducin family protein [Candidatus Acidoferrales bacterium]|nr:class II aldolase/adducin family protein [Candidatus Acidoferrales bacterium]
MWRIKIALVIAVCAAFVYPVSSRPPQAPASTAPDPKLIDDLVYANRILYNENVLDGFGHVSARSDKDPSHFFLARSMAPGLVTAGDIMEYDGNGEPIDARGRNSYVERYIHAAIYRARPDVKSVVHSHSPDIIPFSVTGTILRPVYHVSAFLGAGAPIFEIRDTDKSTDMLVRNNKLGDALAKALGDSAVVLMRGHGYVAVGYSVPSAVYRAIYTQINARVQAEAMKLGPVNFLSAEEIPKAQAGSEAVVGRSWELWKARVGKIE